MVVGFQAKPPPLVLRQRTPSSGNALARSLGTTIWRYSFWRFLNLEMLTNISENRLWGKKIDLQ